MQLKRLFLTPAIFAKYGSLNPDYVPFSHKDYGIAINPKDNRAYKKIVMDRVRGRISTPMHFWADHVAHLNPGICLDIGANYGECFAFGRYGADTICLAVEANPVLSPYLARTHATHPDSARIRLVSCLLGSTDAQQAALYYNEQWTGGGSGVKYDESLRSVAVETRTMDSVLAEFAPAHDARALVMKMDVEGFEGKVLQGFAHLPDYHRVAAIMEFDVALLTQAGTPPEEVFNALAARFQVYVTHNKNKALRRVTGWGDLAGLSDGHKTLHCDLAFYTDEGCIAPGWTVMA